MKKKKKEIQTIRETNIFLALFAVWLFCFVSHGSSFLFFAVSAFHGLTSRQGQSSQELRRREKMGFDLWSGKKHLFFYI